LGSVLVVREWYLDGKEKIDSRFRGNDIWRSGNDIWSNEIAAPSSKAHHNRGININHIYLQMVKSVKTVGKYLLESYI